jgi:putative transcriptional regulator
MELPAVQLQKGTLLIASPEVESGLFFRGVLLVCEHNTNGSFGILINKPMDIDLPEDVLSLSSINNPRVQMRTGGPVQTNQMMLLHTSQDPSQHVMPVCDGVFLGGNIQFLQEMLLDENGPYLYLCFGYAGWTAGQLEREFLDGSWLIHPGSKKYIFETPYDQLWRQLLLDMGGRYATLSMIPEDLSVN